MIHKNNSQKFEEYILGNVFANIIKVVFANCCECTFCKYIAENATNLPWRTGRLVIKAVDTPHNCILLPSSPGDLILLPDWAE